MARVKGTPRKLSSSSTSKSRFKTPKPELSIDTRSFQELVREVIRGMRPGLRFQSKAVHHLQEAAEAYLAELFTDAQISATGSRRSTVYRKDLLLARRIRGERFSQ